MTGVSGAVKQVARDTGEALGEAIKNIGGDVVKGLKGEQGIEGVGSGQQAVKKQQDLTRKSQEEEIKKQKSLKYHRDFLKKYKQEQTEYWQEQEAKKEKKREEEETEDQGKIVQLQEEKQKEEAISVKRAKTRAEVHRGVSG